MSIDSPATVIGGQSAASADPAEAPSDTPRRFSRRKFMAISGGVLAAGAGGYYAIRHHVNVGLVGVGNRGEYHAWLLKWLSYGGTPYGKVLAICDVDIDRAKAVRNAHWSSAEVFQDYRQLLKKDDIEAIYIATHDVWHAGIAIDAMRAGKAVYIEKPVSLTIEEGFRLRDVAEKTGAIVQVGTQQRSHTPFHRAWELVNNGRLGDLKKIVVSLSKVVPPSDLSTTSRQPPAPLDWNMWLGPTAEVPYCDYRHKAWHAIAEYSGGELTNWGSHHLDIALWASGNHHSYPSVVDGKGTMSNPPLGSGEPTEFLVSMVYPSGLTVELTTYSKDTGILFEGNRGRIFVNRARVSGKIVEELATNPLPPDARHVNCRTWPGSSQKLSEMQHYRDFFECIRTKDTPISDIKSSVCVITALHLAAHSIALGRPLSFDPDTMSIKNDPDATALISRERRRGFSI
jgi:myo-inositol 2-dehydrogenase/D-chiro-inositol 1-dehydrogenase